MSGRKHTEQTRKKMSEANLGRKHSDETRKKISDTTRGVKKSGETKMKISDSLKGVLKSEQTKGKISVAMLGKPKIEGSGRPSQQISVIDNKTNQTTTYDSIRAAARALNIHKGVIDMYFSRNQQKPYKGRYTFALKKI
jgi:group I intron endonuclease